MITGFILFSVGLVGQWNLYYEDLKQAVISNDSNQRNDDFYNLRSRVEQLEQNNTLYKYYIKTVDKNAP
jgi:hypothetical protein